MAFSPTAATMRRGGGGGDSLFGAKSIIGGAIVALFIVLAYDMQILGLRSSDHHHKASITGREGYQDLTTMDRVDAAKVLIRVAQEFVDAHGGRPGVAGTPLAQQAALVATPLAVPLPAPAPTAAPALLRASSGHAPQPAPVPAVAAAPGVRVHSPQPSPTPQPAVQPAPTRAPEPVPVPQPAAGDLDEGLEAVRLKGGCMQKPWTATSFRSLGKLTQVKGGRLEDPEVFERVIRDRSYNCEIIVLTANTGGTLMAASKILNLNKVGIDHYILLTRSEKHCRRLLASQTMEISCVWTEFLLDEPWAGHMKRWDVHECEHCADAFGLWLARIHYLAEFVDRGINAMYLDCDVTFQEDPYRLLKSEPLNRYHLFSQWEARNIHGMNIGMVYCQNCAPGGRGQWVLRETVNRIKTLLALEKRESIFAEDEAKGIVSPPYDMHGAKQTLWDQHTFNDVMETSVTGIESRRRTFSVTVRDADGQRRRYEEAHGYHEPNVMEFEVYGDDVHYLPLKLPEDAPGGVEYTVAAPTWFVGGWAGVVGEPETQGVFGWWHEQGKAPAITHFVGAPDKPAAEKSLGWWDYKAEEVDNFVHGRPADAFDQRKYITVKGPTFMYGDLDTFVDQYFKMVARLLVLAILSGRHAVAPTVPCDSPWINTRNELQAWHGIEQAPMRIDWQPGEPRRNGALTGMCDFDPGPDATPGHVCCYPWLRAYSGGCSHLSYMLELEYVLESNPKARETAKVFNANQIGLGKDHHVTSEAIHKAIDADVQVVYLELESDELPVVELSDQDRNTLRQAFKNNHCAMLKKELSGVYRNIRKRK